MKELADVHKIKHHFTVAYSPWINVTVESCMKHIQAANRCLQSVLKLGPPDWPLITGMIQTSLNEAPLARLGTRGDGTYRTPLEVMTGLKPARVMLRTSQIGEAQCEVKNMEKAKAMQMLDIDGLRRVFAEMHKYVAEKFTKNRARQIKHHNKKTNLIVPDFGLGDFVLVRRAQNKGHKQSFRWVGPRRVVKVVVELVCDVEDVITNEVERVHASRLLTYRADFDGKVVSPDLLKHIAHSETKYELVGEFVDIDGNKRNGVFLLVMWEGSPDRPDWTWQQLEELYEDVPEKVKEFLVATKKKRQAREAREMLGLS